jgi:outer membrane protein TolC
VNVSEAKMLLLRAQDSVQQSLAELGRAMGSDQPANYQLAEEALPAGPATTPEQLIAQALGNRPELMGSASRAMQPTNSPMRKGLRAAYG